VASGGLRYYLSLDSRGFSKGARQAEGDLSRLQRVSGTSFNAMRLGGLAAAAAVGTTLAAGIRTGYQEMAEAQKVGAQTAAVIKSTGGAAGITRKQVEDLAGSLQGLTGVEDDAIQSGQNVLLTFTKISKETFPQATRAALDLSVAFGKDMTSSSLMVGKALQDPIKGVSALTRAGVSFTQQQKDQIKAMVEAGKTADAQKLILAELNKQVGGSGAAFGKTLPGQIERAKRAWEDVTQELMTQLLPAFTDLVQFVNRNMPRIRVAIQGVADTVRGVVKFVQAVIAQDWSQAWALARTAAVKAIRAIAPALKNLGGWLLSAAADAGRAIGRGLYNGIYAALQKLPGPVKRFLGLSGSTDTTNVSGRQNFDFGAGPVTSRATGGWIPGRYDARDDVPALLSRGEVVLNPRQASLVGIGRINTALAATGGVIGGNRFARGGVAGAYDRAVGKLGTKYQYGKWDCSDYAYYVAGMNPWGTTASAFNSDSVPARGDEPVLWGLRKSHNSAGWIAGPKEHMGVGVLGPDGKRRWFDNGSGGVESNSDSARWQVLRVPKTWAGVSAGSSDGFDTATETRDSPGARTETGLGLGEFKKQVPGLKRGGRASAAGLTDIASIDERHSDDSLEERRITAAGGKRSAVLKDQIDELKQDVKDITARLKSLVKRRGVIDRERRKLIREASNPKTTRVRRQRIAERLAELNETRTSVVDAINTLAADRDDTLRQAAILGYDLSDAVKDEAADAETASGGDSDTSGSTEPKTTSSNAGLTDYLASIGEFGAVKRGAGDLGAGGRTAWDASWTPAGGAVTVVVQTLHPGDPSVIADIGRTVVASMAGLPSTPSTTYMSGA
jgi:seryl-tRNA synthetase